MRRSYRPGVRTAQRKP